MALKTKAFQIRVLPEPSVWLKAGPAPALSTGADTGVILHRKGAAGLIPFYLQGLQGAC